MSERDYGEPWHSHRGEVCNRHNEVIVYCEGTPTEEEANRIVACVNACAGMADPAQEIAALRAENERLREVLSEMREAALNYRGAITLGRPKLDTDAALGRLFIADDKSQAALTSLIGG